MRLAPLYTPQRELLCQVIRIAPGASIRELARLVGLDEATVDYHLRRLEKAGVVRREKRGRSLAHFLTGVNP